MNEKEIEEKIVYDDSQTDGVTNSDENNFTEKAVSTDKVIEESKDVDEVTYEPEVLEPLMDDWKLNIRPEKNSKMTDKVFENPYRERLGF